MIKSKYILDILNLLLDGDNDGIKARQQIEYLTESNYEYTESGVFISFKHNKGIKKHQTEKEKLILDGVKIKSKKLKFEANATLFFEKGIINYLEIWCYDGKYPENELKNYELTQEWENSPKRKIITE